MRQFVELGRIRLEHPTVRFWPTLLVPECPQSRSPPQRPDQVRQEQTFNRKVRPRAVINRAE